MKPTLSKVLRSASAAADSQHSALSTLHSALSTFSRILLATCALLLFSLADVHAQGTNSPGLINLPNNPPVGIGTQVGTPMGPQNALQINFDTNYFATTSEAILRLSNADGYGTSSPIFGILGLMSPHLDASYSSLSRGQDLILHENLGGDIIITNYWPYSSLTHETGGSIRFATAGYTVGSPLPADSTRWRPDYERLTIGINGNVGIDLPPTTTSHPDTALDTALDQVQIGGGSVAPPGELDPLPGLTISGGYPWEGLPILGGGTFPVDYRYLAFNSYIDHSVSSSARFKRFARMASSGMSFADRDQGTLQLWAEPYDPAHSNNMNHNMTLNLTGQYGLSLWQYSADSIDPYHHIFDAYPPHMLYGPVTRNTNGLFYHHTPVYIGSDSTRMPLVNFQNLPVKPDMGDDTTWTLVVNGPMLAKEIFVLDSTWADYVFDPVYKLAPLGEVENYIKANHHLPDIEPASKIAQTGLPVGRTEAALTKKVEELTLYTIELNKEVEALKADIQELKEQKGK